MGKAVIKQRKLSGGANNALSAPLQTRDCGGQSAIGKSGAWALITALALVGAPLAPAFAAELPASQLESGLIKCAPAKPARKSTLPEVGVHPRASSGLTRLYGGVPINVTTFHYDAARTGWNASETDLTPATVSSSSFGLLKKIPVVGTVMGQPLLVSGYTFPDSSVHDVLIVTTSANMVYAFDAQSYAVLWNVNLGPPVYQPPSPCKQPSPPGIASTPVIGPGATPGSMVLYISNSLQPSATVYESQIRALDLGSGQDVQSAITLNASTTMSTGQTVSFDPSLQYNRAGLALANGALYVGMATYCETVAGSTIGWMFRVSADFSSQTAVPMIGQDTARRLLSGIWMSGFAPAVDSSGNVYATVGNGDATQATPMDWGVSLLKFPPALTSVVDYFRPSNYRPLASADVDFSSGGVTLIPSVQGQTAPPLAISMGKNPVIYLLNQNNLGHYSSTNHGALQSLTVGSTTLGGVWGGPAFYNGPNGPTIYYQISDDVLRSYSLSTGSSPALTLSGQGTTLSSNGGSTPVVSSNGSTAGTGVVWLVRRTSRNPPAEAVLR